MDNKLSELTHFMLERFSMNPVSSKIVGEEWRKTFPDEYAVAKVIRALLAELEAKDKRIAELERANTSQDDHINQQQDRIDSLEKTNAGLGRRLGDAEKRLATPVRLPDTRQSVSGDRYQWSDGVFNYKQDAIAMLRAAGFTVEEDE